jgi:3-oxoadipate enol-lactonase
MGSRQHTAGLREVNGARLHVEEDGAGPPVVLVHGFALDARMWEDQVGPLAARYRVTRHDARGFGRSSVPGTAPYAHTDDLAALVRQFGTGPAVIVGLSMGGAIALDFALDHPDLTRALVLIDAVVGGFVSPPAWDAEVTPVWQAARSSGVAAARPIWLGLSLFTHARRHPAAAARLQQMTDDYSGWHWVNHDPHRAADPPALHRLEQITAPTLVLVGEHDLPDFHAAARQVQARVAGARLEIVPAAGHMANMEAPEVVNRHLLAFLDGLPPLQ